MVKRLSDNTQKLHLVVVLFLLCLEGSYCSSSQSSHYDDSIERQIQRLEKRRNLKQQAQQHRQDRQLQSSIGDNSNEYQTHDTCTTDFDCQHGICKEPTEIMKYRHCHCGEGFTGIKCTRYCPYSCQNGGVCSKKINKNDKQHQYKLQHGDTDLDIDSFDKTFLEESGTLDKTQYEYNKDNYVCKCHGYFTGQLCEMPYVNCGQNKRCHNGGTCIHIDGVDDAGASTSSITCNCPIGFDGDSCQNVASEEPKLTKKGKVSVSMIVLMFALFGVFVYLVKRTSKNGLPRYVSYTAAPSGTKGWGKRRWRSIFTSWIFVRQESEPISPYLEDDCSSVSSESSTKSLT
jgi:hypothetical protein